jgi:hypothetical protein
MVYTGKLLGVMEMDDFEWAKVKYYVLYVISFAIGTWANIKARPLRRRSLAGSGPWRCISAPPSLSWPAGCVGAGPSFSRMLANAGDGEEITQGTDVV